MLRCVGSKMSLRDRGVGMLGGEDLTLPYPWIMRNLVTVKGQWMYPREAMAGMVGMVRAGLLEVSHFAVTEFTLDDANVAVAHAVADAGPFQLTVLKPWPSPGLPPNGRDHARSET